MSSNIQQESGIITKKEQTKVYKDNLTCVVQLKDCYIKNDKKKHILPKFILYIQELEKNQEVYAEYILSCDSSTDLFTKAFFTTTVLKTRQLYRDVVFA